jgi:small subunit ribosomal protein S7e
VVVDAGKKAIVIFVPFRKHKNFKKIQDRLIKELEKKFSGQHVTFIAQRTILSKNYKRTTKGQLRPRSRTLTAVHEAILEDIVYPTALVGKRWRYTVDGQTSLKVFLDPKDVKEVDYKLKTFEKVYTKLTNKAVSVRPVPSLCCCLLFATLSNWIPCSHITTTHLYYIDTHNTHAHTVLLPRGVVLRNEYKRNNGIYKYKRRKKKRKTRATSSQAVLYF